MKTKVQLQLLLAPVGQDVEILQGSPCAVQTLTKNPSTVLGAASALRDLAGRIPDEIKLFGRMLTVLSILILTVFCGFFNMAGPDIEKRQR